VSCLHGRAPCADLRAARGAELGQDVCYVCRSHPHQRRAGLRLRRHQRGTVAARSPRCPANWPAGGASGHGRSCPYTCVSRGASAGSSPSTAAAWAIHPERAPTRGTLADGMRPPGPRYTCGATSEAISAR
jgi:hypothetical protein